MEKINVAELLKDCPKGMELDCAMYDKVYLSSVDNDEGRVFPIKVRRVDGNFMTLTKYGQYTDGNFSKCVIFPKGKTTWEGFVPPYEFKDEDVVVAEGGELSQLFLLKYLRKKNSDSYGGYCYFGWDFQNNKLFEKGDWGFDRLATEEEKQKLFKTIKDNGYQWNEEAKTLEKLTEPIFKINDNIQSKDIKSPVRIVDIKDGNYIFENGDTLDINLQNRWEFVSNKFDINKLIPFESKVLVRDYPNEKWKPAIWGFYDNDNKDYSSYIIESGIVYNYCIPYKGNEHLIGTINECEKYYKTWEDEN